MREVILQIWKMINKKNRKRLIGVFAVTLSSTVLEMLGVSLIVPIVATITNPDLEDRNSILGIICALLNINDTKTLMSYCLFALIVVYIIKNLVYVLNSHMQIKFVCDCRYDVQKRLLNSFINREYEYYLNSSSGEIVRIIYSDTNQTFDLLRSLIAMCSEVLISCGLVVTIFIIDWQMTVFVASLLIVIAMLVVVIIKPILKREGIELQNSCTKIYNWLIQIIDGIKVIKVSRKGSCFEQHFQKSVRKRDRSEELNVLLSSIPRMMIELFSVCSILGYLLYRTFSGSSVESLLPALGAFAMAAVKLMPGINRIVNAINAMAYDRPAVMQVYNNLYYSNKVTEDKCEVIIPTFNKIELRDLSFKYPYTSKNIFDKSEMIINKGSTIGIIGPSGSGKTTLVDILLGLLSPQSGKLIVDDNVINLQEEKCLFSVGYIPQTVFLLDTSVKNNIAFGIDDDEIDESRVRQVIQEAQLEEYISSLPENINTTIGEKGVRLSGGQRQRIGIARALYSNPDLLVFDEATSALDNETEQAVMDAISILKGRKTMIIIAHRTNTLRDCDYIYRVDKSKIVREK